MTRNKLGILILGVFAISLLANCSKETQTKKVVLLGSAYTIPGQKEAWDEVAAAFTSETGIAVELRRQGTWDEIPQALQTARLAQEQIDLCVVGIGTVRAVLGPAGVVMDITDLMKDLEDRFPEGILDGCRIGGHLWAVPYADASGTTFFYNKTLFNQLGIEPPATMNDFVQIAGIIKEKTGMIPLSFHGKDGWAWPMLFFDTYSQSSGGRSIENVEAFLRGQREFTGEAERQGLLLIKALYDSGIFSNEVFDTDQNGMLAAFTQKKAAMIFGGTWNYPVLQSMDKDFEIGAFEFPQVAAGAKPIHAFAVGDGAIEIPSFANQDNLENTMRFIEFILRPENAKKILSVETPLFEIVNGAMGPEDPVTQFLNERLVPNSVMYLDWIWPGEINDAIGQVIPAVVSGRTDSDQALAAIQRVFETIKAEKNYEYDWWNKWTSEDWAKVQPKNIPDVRSFKK
jgi:raffinose/stachyose/melibiose transport system substrate-binding protein